MIDEFNDRTCKALGFKLMERLRSQSFCIIGNGGIGANFAEMLVRSGATRIRLIDGSMVERSNLNRTFGFTELDIESRKAKTLRKWLETIQPDGLSVTEMVASFRKLDETLPADRGTQNSIRLWIDCADFVLIATDTNQSRIAIEEYCREKKVQYASCGVYVDANEGVFEFECALNPVTPPDRSDDQDYGPENASYAAIVMEATSVLFSMMLNYMSPGRGKLWTRYVRTYDKDFLPINTIIEKI